MTYPISQAAQRAGATVHQVRTYVAAGLVQPCAMTAGGHYLFNEDCVARLRLIAAATRAGLRISEIGALVKALERNNPRAVRIAQTCGTAIPRPEGESVTRGLIARTRLARQAAKSKEGTALDRVQHRNRLPASVA